MFFNVNVIHYIEIRFEAFFVICNTKILFFIMWDI